MKSLTCTALTLALTLAALADVPTRSWNFRAGSQGWIANAMVTESRHGDDGWEMKVTSPDPFITSPRFEWPTVGYVQVTLRMRSTGGTIAQMYFGKQFTENDSRSFAIDNDGKWHNYRLILPALGPAARLRLDPSMSDGTIAIDWIRAEPISDLPNDRWSRPNELRNKKMIGGGLYTVYGDETAITPRYLAEHPEFADNYPFDGIVLPAQLSDAWVASLGLTKQMQPLRPKFLHELLWTKIAIPDEAVAQTIADLKVTPRGSLTDNFMIYGMLDGARGLHTPNLARDEDWEILQRNASLAARVCREGKLKGIWLDTEQYGHYRWRTESGVPEFDPGKPSNLHFPLGKDTPEILRQRGTQWIKAIQAEFPDVKIITTFAWSPDGAAYGPLTGVIPFLDGVLEGITAPGEIIHGHENTFYFGQAPGTTHTYATPGGFPGDRQRYESARIDIRKWRSLSSNPQKYDAFVKVGMAAWVEDHPWNTPDGWPDGIKASLWSNLPLALAYSDQYVWVWSEHTKYGQPDKREVNPFLASLNNQTINGSNRPEREISEPFETAPWRHGWAFDFDMLRIGRKLAPEHEVALMSSQMLPYRWDSATHSLLVQDIDPSQQNLIGQRRRFVRTIEDLSEAASFQMSIDFIIDKFDTQGDSPIAVGLFHSESDVAHRSLIVKPCNAENAQVAIRFDDSEMTIPLRVAESLQMDRAYRVVVEFDASTRVVRAKIGSLSSASGFDIAFESPWNEVRLPAGAKLHFDEIGGGLSEATRAKLPAAPASQLRVLAIRLAGNRSIPR